MLTGVYDTPLFPVNIGVGFYLQGETQLVLVQCNRYKQ